MFIEYPSFEMAETRFMELSEVFSLTPGTSLLYSGGNYQTSNVSYLFLFPKESLSIEGKTLFHQALGKEIISTIDSRNPWEGAKRFLPEESETRQDCPDWIGYFGYEMGAYSDEEKCFSFEKSIIPDACFLRPSVILKFCYTQKRVSLYAREAAISFLTQEEKKDLQYLTSDLKIQDLIDERRCIFNSKEEIQMELLNVSDDFTSYRKKIECAKELIYSGEIYQVNLSQRFQFLKKGQYSPFEIFKRSALINPAPFMAYLHFPKFTVVSTSPERYLCKRGEKLETLPIKGTKPRGSTPAQDKKNKKELLHSAKEKAELLMITDLMRNDLGRISQTGSVVVEKIWGCEAFANVFHLHSKIVSKRRKGLHPIDIIRAAFPGGSITGCPKLRAMEVIAELEERPRGIYTGSIGYFSSNGDFDFNIAIRTLLCKENLVEVQLGGAIVVDSDPQKEYEEVFHKGATLFQALGISNKIAL